MSGWWRTMNCSTIGMRSRTELMFQVVIENVIAGPLFAKRSRQFQGP
jgi:hypothetical protein